MTPSSAQMIAGFRFALAIGLALFALAGSADAIDAAAYKAQVDAARAKVAGALGYTAAAEMGESDPAAEAEIVASIRAGFPSSQKVSWQGQTVEVSNQAIHKRLTLLEKETDPTKRAVYLTEIDELLSAISSQLESPPAAGQTSKDEHKRKLAEILARDEYQKPVQQQKSGISAMIERFLEWLRSFFPDSGPAAAAPYDFSGFAKVLQVLLFVLIFALIGFLIYKFEPVLFPPARRAAGGRKNQRTILGEKIAADESSADLFGEAERLAREGEIRAAIRKGYVALLCELSDKNVIALEQHKTNRDYLRDVRTRAALYASMRGLTSSFERHWYGARRAGPGDWEAFRETYKKAVGEV